MGIFLGSKVWIASITWKSCVKSFFNFNFVIIGIAITKGIIQLSSDVCDKGGFSCHFKGPVKYLNIFDNQHENCFLEIEFLGKVWL